MANSGDRKSCLGMHSPGSHKDSGIPRKGRGFSHLKRSRGGTEKEGTSPGKKTRRSHPKKPDAEDEKRWEPAVPSVTVRRGGSPPPTNPRTAWATGFFPSRLADSARRRHRHVQFTTLQSAEELPSSFYRQVLLLFLQNTPRHCPPVSHPQPPLAPTPHPL